MSLLIRTSAIGLSMILRSGLLLLISGIVYSAHAAADATAFFQIIYLQAVAIAFISASGFFRVQAIETDEDLAGYLAATALMIPLSALLPIGVALVLPEYADRLAELAIAWVGAIATALSAPFSGIVLKRRGALAAFLPACLAAVLAMAFLAGASRYGLQGLTPYLALTGFQVISVGLLLVQIRPVVVATFGRLARLRSGMPWPDLHEASVVGALNVLIMLVVFAVRQLWVQKAGAEIGAAVLLTLRISDSVLQLFSMVMAGHRMVTQLIRSRWALAVQLGSAGVSVGLVLAAGQLAAASAVPVMAFAVLAQIALDLSRIPWSVGFLYQMKHFRLARFAAFSLVQPALGLAAALWPILAGRAEGLAIFLAVSITSGAIITTLQTRRDESRAAGQKG